MFPTILSRILLCVSVISSTCTAQRLGGYYDGSDLCPVSCQSFPTTPDNWTTFHQIERLDACPGWLLLDFAVRTPLDDNTKQKTIRTCTVKSDQVQKVRRQGQTQTPTNGSTDTAQLQVVRVGDSGNGSSGASVGAAQIKVLLEHNSIPDTGILFAKHGDVSLAIYVGARVARKAAADTILQRFLNDLRDHSNSQGTLMQACGANRTADNTAGVVFQSGPSSISQVQKVVVSWLNGSCSESWGKGESLGAIQLPLLPVETSPVHRRSIDAHWKRADCRTIQVVSGDSCGSLASKCGISGADYTKYNPSKDHCSTLRVGQHVCCSSGTLPDFKPKPNSDGSCASYAVASGDYCNAIAGKYDLTVADLESFNKNTWGWAGCNNLQAGIKMCISTGSPPMPAAVSNAICGPQKPGTQAPAKGTSLASLNPCPLNACCNIWGQCGIDNDYCVDTSLGPPGTAKPGTNGCISNCGTSIVNNGSPPSEFMKVGYFEAFNGGRKCLQMDASQIDTTKYTHVHYGFGDITQDFRVDVSKYQTQFQQFRQLKNIKKIISFGGWGFSTEPASYMILRNAAKSANRDTFTTNLANFVKQSGLDGVDIDWEYAGAQDIPGIPPADKNEGADYLAMLKLLKSKLPNNLVAIAAPASFWYLQAFPIADMAKVIDYIVYMTYDLHGQWDYGSKWASPGCPNGDCLRSHVNMTETQLALAMVTKAGVPSNKLVLGVTSYGRSFKMTTAGCTGPNCKYTGPDSGATPGECTGTAGYLANAEIDRIIKGNSNVQQFKDNANSNIMVYNGNQWVAYMDDTEKARRTSLYKGWNFAGTSDWAIDLNLQPPPSGGNTQPAPSTDPNYPRVNGAVEPYIEGCTQPEGQMIMEAWREAAALAQIHREWVPGGKWQKAMDVYIGKTSKNDNGFFVGPQPRYKNVQRQYNIHYAGWGSDPLYTYAYFKCDSANKTPGCYNHPTSPAYTTDDLGWFWSAHYVTFCPTFFSKEMFSLADRVSRANGNINQQRTMDKFWRRARARTMFHETYHWKDTVSIPRCVDKAYQPPQVAKLARDDEPNAAINAESYAQAALAIYIQKTFNLADPPMPAYIASDGNTTEDYSIDAPYNYVATSEDFPNRVPIESKTFTPNNSTGNIRRGAYYGSNLGPRWTECNNGQLYSDQGQCSEFCSDGKCEDKKEAGWNCNCAGGVCKEATYKDFDECGDNCFQGLCSESAGIQGVRCIDCPPPKK